MFKVNDLVFKYPKNSEPTLKGLTFEIAKGEIFGFLGPSGAGKTTTQKLLVKLLPYHQGQIFFDGKELHSFDDSFYEDIGVCFEMPISFSKLTAMENLQFFQKLYKNHAEIQPLMERLGLWVDRDKLVGEYSKGMKMLFLDEPTNGLDPKNARIVKEIIREFARDGGTVFLTSHIMSDVDELCDRVAFIAEGKLTEIDSPRNLKIKYGQRTVTLEYKENGGVVSTTYPMDAIKNDEFAEVLKTKDIETIHSGETTLEEVTGVKLHGED